MMYLCLVGLNDDLSNYVEQSKSRKVAVIGLLIVNTLHQYELSNWKMFWLHSQSRNIVGSIELRANC